MSPVPARTVFISSTSIDLPEHRRKVIEACNQLGLIPDGMEHWPATDASALELCLAKVDKADVFVGVYAHRYGWVPPGETKSITELEYDRAAARGIPRHLFAMGEDHDVKRKDVETGAGADALLAFKQRIGDERVWKTFDNPDQLHAAVLHALVNGDTPPADTGGSRIYFNDHFPQGAKHFLGRRPELKALDQAWADSGRTHIVTLIAPGGTGKTALVKRWLDGMKRDDWRGAERVFGWSFYSQGTSEASQASEDGFLAKALDWFGVAHNATLHPSDKGRLLAEALATKRCLLVLDGVEPLQYPPGPLAGQLRAPGLQALLRQLALAGHAGLCVVSSRVRLKDLDDSEQGRGHLDGTVLRRDLGNLGQADGAKLLHAQGADKAGKTAIAPNDAELLEACAAVKGHALTLALLGRYLAKAHHGDIRKRNQVKLAKADADGHAFKVIAAYEQWFAREGEASSRELAALRLLGFFDRPALEASLLALRTAPAIAGLTEALQGLDDADWNTTLASLADCGLAQPDETSGALDAHPLVREYLAETLKDRQSEAWREGHRRLYEQLKASVPHHPDGLDGLQPLYQAIAHGCLAGLWQQACDEGYSDRILRGTGHDGFYSSKKLGAFGADLGAIACFFIEPWRQPVPVMAEGQQAWLLSQAAYCLRALGRLEEALEPMRAGAEMRVKHENWRNAALNYANLSALKLSLGRIAAAVADAQLALDYAVGSGDAFQRRARRTEVADALHQQGKAEAAEQSFVAAEAMQAEDQPQYPQLYGLAGFRYGELLLAEVERAAWRGTGEGALTKRCAEVAARAAQTLKWAKENNLSLLTIALDHLTLARCALYAARLQGQAPDADAQTETECAVARLRTAGAQHQIPRGLLTRAWLRHCLNDLPGAKADLDEAQQIAARGSMRLHLADIALTRARLFRDPAELAKARALIEECGYGRRLPELADAEALLAASAPAKPPTHPRTPSPKTAARRR